MDEIRCPMCGKLNPPDLETCQYCQARLKPLIVSQPTGETEGTSLTPEEENLPDWLKDLRSQDEQVPAGEESGSEEGPSAEEEDEADWLKHLRDQSFTEEDERAGGEVEGGLFTDESTGLERLSEIEPRGEEAAPPEEILLEGSGGEPTWHTSAEPKDEDELPDWLSDVSPDLGEGEPGVPEGEPAAPAEEALPDWLSSLRPAEEEQLPAWSPEAGSESDSSGDFEAEEEALPEEEKEEAEEPGKEEVQADVPAWLKDLKADRAESIPPSMEAGEGKEEEPALEKAELPEWMAGLQESQAAEEAEAEVLPDWLTTSEPETSLEIAKSELPDWLSPVEAPEAEEVTAQEEMPEWLGSFTAEEAEESLELPSEAEEGLEKEEPPEWLADLEKEFSAGPVEESVAPFTLDEEGIEEAEEFVAPAEEELEEQPEQEEPPSWLAELEKEFPSEAGEESVPPFVPGEEEIELAAAEAPSSPVEAGADFLESMPEWAAEVPEEMGAEGEGEEPSLAEAELPGWLEAMRPVESVPLDIVEPEEPAEQVETSGPLAGLSGILAAESDFARVRKPPAYSVKLHVTDNQEARVALLKEMLQAEDKQKPLPARPVITSRYILRLVIALALIIPIAWAVISGESLTPVPDPASAPAGVLDMRQQIDGHLSASLPVLVAVDYEAGFSGELDLPSRAVLAHMIDKGAYLTFVSTSTSGPILAERLVDSLNQAPTRKENPFNSYANLGYVPGGTAGLLGLAQSPRQIVPYTLKNVDIWKSAPLDVIDGVADFSMALVITDNPETARAWIEQVQPFLKEKDTPLLMVVSAQAEPLIMPYYQGSSRQVDALLVGFQGGAAYESMLGQGALASGSWDAFSLSMLVTEIILVAGAVIGLGSTLFTSNKKEEA